MGRRREGVLDIAIGHRDEGGDIGGEVAVAARRRSRERVATIVAAGSISWSIATVAAASSAR
jgi:hypothetical protein